ncbi:MarR family winged helix-turn-helix transcriptional regulator [Microbacterium sp.]|uniref:MarR family winged helix-turn-helix transcriptional regulator n=1 Tax=Microbacterium sp. TaxID=51671 RepID=UPI0039E5B031
MTDVRDATPESVRETTGPEEAVGGSGTRDAGRDEAVQELEAEFGALFARARRLMAEAAGAISPGLQPGAYKVFTTIARRSGCTLSALADELGIDKGQLSRAVTELEGLGLVSRTPAPDDRRAQLLSPTAHGSARLEAARGARRRAMADRLSTWPVEDIRDLSRLLRALSGGL